MIGVKNTEVSNLRGILKWGGSLKGFSPIFDGRDSSMLSSKQNGKKKVALTFGHIKVNGNFNQYLWYISEELILTSFSVSVRPLPTGKKIPT